MIVIALLLIAAHPNTPIARGSYASVEAVGHAARACGMRDIRFDPLDDKRAILLVGKKVSHRALRCTFNWMQRYEEALKLEPLFEGNLAR